VAAAAARHAASEAAKCAHTETGLSVLRAALHNVFGHGEHGLAVKIFVNKEKAEVELVYTEKEVALADRRDAIEAECDRLIALSGSGGADTGTGLPALQVVGSCAHTKHAQLESVGALDSLRIIKPKKSKKADMFEFEFVVGATAKTLDKKRRDDLAAVNSKKTAASVEKAAKAKAAASPSPVAAASPDAAAAASPSAASASSSSSNGPASAAPAAASSSSGDYVVETTQSVFHDLALPAFARSLLLGQMGAAAAPAAATDDALAAAASLLTPEQQSGLLTRAQLKELKDLPPESRSSRLVSLVGASRLISALTPAQLESTLPAPARAALLTDLLPSLESYMVMFANQAYTRGFQAAKKGSGNIDLATLL
jgi:hypothetical protein